MAGRYLIAGLFAAVVTFALFFAMRALITMEAGPVAAARGGRRIDFVRLKRESELQLKQRQMPAKAPPPAPPPLPEIDLTRAPRPQPHLESRLPAFALALDIAGGPSLGAAPSDTDVIPLVRVNPQYPIGALEREIEGWVEVEFTITAAGTVRDAVAVASEPGSVFDRAARHAVRRWRYKPKVVDGVAVERPGVRVKLTFKLEDE